MYVGTATWTIPKNDNDSFPIGGTHLERYSKVFNAVEINTSFYKDHLAKSYTKWALVTPDEFRFSVKLNQRFTHTCEDTSALDLSACLESIAYLENKWRVLLLQFPAGKNFNALNMNRMLKIIRKRFDGIVALEPRNLTWACDESILLIKEYNVTKVFADPEKCPGVNIGLEKYYRLHGSPEIYCSNYEDGYLENIYSELSALPHEAWCIFDNTALGHATTNALKLTHKGEFYEGRTQLHEDRATTSYTSHKY